ncbi:MAG TPA: ATP-binding cassette domain-containing protein, partial [Solirubrobacteraceae bacterium]|nr:ATP-binding cassette domain-containing protein [Solirubrobacteraceae bacterium]
MENDTITPEQELLDPWSETAAWSAPAGPARVAPAGLRDAATRRDDTPTDEHSASAREVVPPVRTIVLDRPPVPVAPPRQREAVRTRLAGSGPERLTLRDVSIHYGAKRAVDNVSLSIYQGEVLALIGPSGCGKTSLLRTLNRLTELTPSAARSGEILLDGHDVHTLQDTHLRARVAMVFQQPNPFPMSI